MFCSRCQQTEPTPSASQSGSATTTQAQSVAAPAAATSLRTRATSNADPAPEPSASALVAPAAAAASGTALSPLPLVDAAGKPLPQTEERPTTDDPLFIWRMQQLMAAIRTDDPELGRAAFFPLIAYEQVKAIKDPKRDYEQRLLAAFLRDLHELHTKFQGRELTYSSVLLDEHNVKWMARGKEGNRLGYFRAVRAVLQLKDAQGKLEPVRITSMISWRGAWYVVHLSGFS